MKAFVVIVKAFVRRSWLLTVLCLLLALAPIVSLPLAGYFPNVPMVTIGVTAAAFASYFVGALFGNVLAPLMDCSAPSVVPGYGSRLLGVTSLLGVLAWVPTPLILGLGSVDLGIVPWLRWTPLWAYGALGGGFLLGVNVSGMGMYKGREFWRRYLLSLSPMLVVAAFSNSAFRELANAPLLATLPGITPLAVLCLLIGPLSWPALLARKVALRQPERSVGTPRRRDLQSYYQRGGSAFDTWYLSRLVARWHSTAGVRPEFLVLSTFLLSSWTMAGFVLIFPILMQIYILLMGQSVSATDFAVATMTPQLSLLLPFTTLTPLMANVLDGPRLGRVLLMPGLPPRALVPSWMFRRLLAVWMFGTAFTLLPALGWAIWYSASAASLSLYALLSVWLVSLAATLTFWRTPSRKQWKGIDTVGTSTWFVLLMATAMLEPLFFSKFSPVVCAVVIGLLFLIPVGLYQSGLKRWKTMEYGA